MQLNLLKIDNCSEQDTQDLEEYIRQLYTYIKKQLQFKVNPIIRLIDDAANSANPLGTTGHYEPETKIITVFITDRHIKDILRSIAHELIHHNQNCSNQISPDSDMSEGYAQKDQDLRALEEEAYSKGNLLFRDWENEMKTDNEQLHETLDNFHEKRQRLITEAVYEKLGFSTEFLKEARKLPPQPTLGDELSNFNAQSGAGADVQTKNAEILKTIISPSLEAIKGFYREYNDTLTRTQRQTRTTQYQGGRVDVPFITDFIDVIKANKGDIVPAALQQFYNAIGKLLDHFNTMTEDPLASSKGRVQDKNLRRKQVWGEKSLEAWQDLGIPVVITAIQTAAKLIKLNPAIYGNIKVVYRPEKGREASLMNENSSLKSFQVAFEKVKAMNATAIATMKTQQTEPEEQPAAPGKVGVSNDVLKNLSETRQNTLNTLRLLESLTNKGKR